MPYEAEAGRITIALVGDAMINRRMAVHREPEYLELLERARERFAAHLHRVLKMGEALAACSSNSFAATGSAFHQPENSSVTPAFAMKYGFAIDESDPEAHG